jgi:ureidoacrylate peracid hydrolase
MIRAFCSALQARRRLLSDATGTFDYPDVGQGALSAHEVHRATLTILAFSTAHVMTCDELARRVGAWQSSAKAA